MTSGREEDAGAYDTGGAAPVITSASSTLVRAGSAFSFPVTATGSPAPTFSLTGAPSWVSIDPTSGALKGTAPATVSGPQRFSVVAGNGVSPDAVQPFTLSVTAVPAADLGVTVTSPTTFVTKKTGTYRIVVTNTGTAATNRPIVVTDHVPDATTFVSAAGSGWTCRHTATLVTCTRSAALARGGTSSLTLQVHVAAPARRVLTDTVTVAPTDGTPADNSATDRLTVRAR